MSPDLGSILITGGTGFLGSHLARRLVQSGADVHVLARPGSSLWRIQDVAAHLTVWRGDLGDDEAVRECLESCRPAAVFHLAGDTSLRVCGLENIERSLGPLRDTLSLICLLQRCRIPIRLFVRAGGLEEYGCGPHPYDENQREAPVSPYSASQVAATHYCQMLQRVAPFAILTLRFALLYGPSQSNEFFIPSLIAHCLENRDFAMTGGEQGRDLLFVEDAIDALVAALHMEAPEGRVLNVGSGCEYRMLDVAEAIRSITASDTRLQIGSRAIRRSEIPHLVCRNDEARRALGWRPRTSLADGLARTAGWYREHAATASAVGGNQL